MLLGSRGSRLRCLFVWTVVTIAATVLGRALVTPIRRTPLDLARLDTTPLDVALIDVAALALLGCAVWVWVAATVVIGGVLRGVEPTVRPPRGIPPGVRRAVLAACGVALAGGLAASPSYADQPRHHAPPVSASSPLVGLPLPDRALSSPERARSAPAPTGDPRPERPISEVDDPGPRRTAVHRPDRGPTVLVRPGDTLWSIAADDLPPHSSHQEIAAHWHEIYRANRAQVGPDPDVITPGQQLSLPRTLPREDDAS